MELAPGGGNPPHTHGAFGERFEVVEGTLHVRLGRETRVLGPGESVTAPRGVVHCFSNPAAAPARFRVELRPGHAGFEDALRIAYGLARDGRTTRGGLPKGLGVIALLTRMSDTYLTGPLSALKPLFGWLARRAARRGVERALRDRYCPPRESGY